MHHFTKSRSTDRDNNSWYDSAESDFLDDDDEEELWLEMGNSG